MDRCQAIKNDGDQCNNRDTTGDGFCFFHHPAKDMEKRAQRIAAQIEALEAVKASLAGDLGDDAISDLIDAVAAKERADAYAQRADEYRKEEAKAREAKNRAKRDLQNVRDEVRFVRQKLDEARRKLSDMDTDADNAFARVGRWLQDCEMTPETAAIAVDWAREHRLRTHGAATRAPADKAPSFRGLA